MELKFAMIADEALFAADGKLSIIGIWDTLKVSIPGAPARIPRCSLAGQLQASVLEGTAHRIRIRLVQDDGDPVGPDYPAAPLTFPIPAPGRPPRANFVYRIQDVALPGTGDFDFEIYIDDVRVGSVPFTVTV